MRWHGLERFLKLNFPNNGVLLKAGIRLKRQGSGPFRVQWYESTVNTALAEQSEHHHASDNEGDANQSCVVDFLIEEEYRNESDGCNPHARPNCVHHANWNAFKSQ